MGRHNHLSPDGYFAEKVFKIALNRIKRNLTAEDTEMNRDLYEAIDCIVDGARAIGLLHEHGATRPRRKHREVDGV